MAKSFMHGWAAWHEVMKSERHLKGNLSATFCDQFIFHHLDNEQAL